MTETIWSPWPPRTTALTSLTDAPGLPRDESLQARGVEDARLAEDALLREAGDVLRDMAHRVERVRDDDQDRVGALRDDLLGDVLDDLLVRRDEIVAAHARRARQARGDHDDLGAGGRAVVVRAGHARLVAEHRAHLVDVERLSLRQAFLDVDEDDVGVVALRENLRARRADVPGSDDGDFPALSSCDHALQCLDDRVCVLARPDRGRIVARGLEVVGDPRCPRRSPRRPPPRAARRVVLAEMLEHQLPGEDHRGRVDLVLALVLRRRAVRRLEDGGVRADVRRPALLRARRRDPR